MNTRAHSTSARCGSDFQSRPPLRRALILSTLTHALIIGVIVIAERSLHEPRPKQQNIVFIPAAPRGELPRGAAIGIGEAPRGNNPIPTPAPPRPPTQNTVAAPRPQPAPTPPRNTTPTAPRPAPTAQTPARTSAPPTNQTAAATPRPTTPPAPQPTRQPTSTAARNTAPSSPLAPQPQSNVSEIRNQLFQGMNSGGRAGIPDGATVGTGVGARGIPQSGTGGGTARGASVGDPRGSSVGVLGGSGAGTPFWDYHLHIHDVLYAAWRQPSQFADPLRPPTVRVRLRIAKDGSLWEAKLAQSSGIREVDESALSATRGTRLKPPPAAMLGGKDFVEITVAFKLGGQG